MNLYLPQHRIDYSHWEVLRRILLFDNIEFGWHKDLEYEIVFSKTYKEPKNLVEIGAQDRNINVMQYFY